MSHPPELVDIGRGGLRKMYKSRPCRPRGEASIGVISTTNGTRRRCSPVFSGNVKHFVVEYLTVKEKSCGKKFFIIVFHIWVLEYGKTVFFRDRRIGVFLITGQMENYTVQLLTSYIHI
jgi:hypothetical protein